MDNEFDFFELFEGEEKSSDISDRINIILQNSLQDNHTTPRAPCYVIGEDKNALEVCLSGADSIFFYEEKGVELKFGTYKNSTAENINELLLIKLLNKLRLKLINASPKLSEELRSEQLKEKYGITSKKRHLTEKQLKEISMYERRKKGDWS